MEDDRSGYYWRNRELDDTNEKSGRYTVEEVQFFLNLLFRVDGCLMQFTPHAIVDLTGDGRGEVWAEVHDNGTMCHAPVTPEQAKELTRLVLEDWDAGALQGKLCDLVIEWTSTSEKDNSKGD